MDPNATLTRIRALTAHGPEALELHEYVELVELTVALDEWLSKGGFFPDAWSWDAEEATA